MFMGLPIKSYKSALTSLFKLTPSCLVSRMYEFRLEGSIGKQRSVEGRVRSSHAMNSGSALASQPWLISLSVPAYTSDTTLLQ